MKAILVASRWKATPARRERVASLGAKVAEILFWLAVVGPFVVERMSLLGWVSASVGFVFASSVSYWFSRGRQGRGGA